MVFKLRKRDKLKSKKQIEQLFSKGKVITAFPLRLVYHEIEFSDGSTNKTGFSVSKRLHKTAVARNRIKRLMKEGFRLNKPTYFYNSSTSYAFMILYISKDGTTFEAIDNSMKKLLKKFNEKSAAS